MARLADLIAGGALDYYIDQYRICVNRGNRNCHDDARRLVETRFTGTNARNLTDLQRRAEQAIIAGQTYRKRSMGYVYDFGKGVDEVQTLRSAGYRGQVEYRYTVTVTFTANTKQGRTFTDSRTVEVRSTENMSRQDIGLRAEEQMQNQINQWLGYGGRFSREVFEAAPTDVQIEAARRTLSI